MECRRTLAFVSWGGWWNEDAMECRDRERMKVATARNGMHRNGRSDHKRIGFPFTECLGDVLTGKGMTEWNEQNNFGAWSGLSRCILALALFCNFFTQNNMHWYASANTRRAIAGLCEMEWGNTLALGAEVADGMELQRNGRSDRKARQNVGFQHL